MADETPTSPRIDQLRARLEKDPESRLFLQLAEEYRRAGALDLAEQTCRAGLENHPNYWAARVALARACVGLGKVPDAISELKKVLAAVPDNILAGKLLGQIYESVGKRKNALSTYRKLQPYDPDDPELSEKIEILAEEVESAKGVPAADAAASEGDAVPQPPSMPEDAPPEAEGADQEEALETEAEPEAVEQEAPSPEQEMEGTAILDEPPELEGDSFLRSSLAEAALPPEMQGEVNEMTHDLHQEIDQAPEDSDASRADSETLDLTPSPDLIPSEITSEEGPEKSEPPAEREAPSPQNAAPAEPPQEEQEEEGEVVSRTMAEVLIKQGHVDQAIETLEKLVLSDKASHEDEARLEELMGQRGDRIAGRLEEQRRIEADRNLLGVYRSWLEAVESL